SCVITELLGLACWGPKSEYLGDSRWTHGGLQQVGYGFSRVLALRHATCGLREGRAPECVGLDSEGRMQRSDAPKEGMMGRYYGNLNPIELPFVAKQLVFGDYHGCALDARGDVWCWGLDNFGQLGSGFHSEVSKTPLRVTLPGPVVQIEAN